MSRPCPGPALQGPPRSRQRWQQSAPAARMVPGGFISSGCWGKFSFKSTHMHNPVILVSPSGLCCAKPVTVQVCHVLDK